MSVTSARAVFEHIPYQMFVVVFRLFLLLPPKIYPAMRWYIYIYMYTMFLNKNPVAMKFFVQGHGNTNISDASCNLQGDAAPSFVCWCINPVKYRNIPQKPSVT